MTNFTQEQQNELVEEWQKPGRSNWEACNAVMELAISFDRKNRAIAFEAQLEGVRAALNSTPGAVRVREGNGPEDLAASVAVTLSKFSRSRM